METRLPGQDEGTKRAEVMVVPRRRSQSPRVQDGASLSGQGAVSVAVVGPDRSPDHLCRGASTRPGSTVIGYFPGGLFELAPNTYDYRILGIFLFRM